MKLSQEDIRRRFKAQGLKVTPQRVAIYKALAETTAHPTAEDLHLQVTQIHPMISPNTVYYTLSVLKEVGLVQEVNYWHDRARFDANVTPHHHLICLQCRAIQDIHDKTLDRLLRRSGIPSDFQVTGHRVEFHGYCAQCQTADTRRTSLPIQSKAHTKGRNS